MPFEEIGVGGILSRIDLKDRNIAIKAKLINMPNLNNKDLSFFIIFEEFLVNP